MSNQPKKKHFKNTTRSTLERGKSKVCANIKVDVKEDDVSMSVNSSECDDFLDNGSETNSSLEHEEAMYESPTKAPKVIETLWKGIGVKWIIRIDLRGVPTSPKHGKSQQMKGLSKVMTPPTSKGTQHVIALAKKLKKSKSKKGKTKKSKISKGKCWGCYQVKNWWIRIWRFFKWWRWWLQN